MSESLIAQIAELHRANAVTKCCPTCGRPAPCPTWRLVQKLLP